MAVVTKKILPVSFEKIFRGNKRCEMRLDNFAIASGDILRLVEHDGHQETGRTLDVAVDYVMKTKEAADYWSAEEIERHGLQIIQFKKKP